MSDFEKRIPDEPMIEEWPEPKDEYEDEDDDGWDYYLDDTNGTANYEVRFKLTGVTVDEMNWISRYLFEVASKHLTIPIEKFAELEIEED